MIQENQWVILKRGQVFKAVKVKRNQKQQFERLNFNLNDAIGKPFHTCFSVEKNNKLLVLDNIPELESYTLKPDDLNEVTVDNSALFDKAQANQALSTEQILAMQKSNVSGADLVDLLSKNSTNFVEKKFTFARIYTF